jgi:hypothetical protein
MAESKKGADAPKKARRVTRPKLVVPAGMEPVYANVVRIAHTPSEIVFDFGQLLPGDPQAPIKSRVMMSPLSAKLLHRALSENLSKYETTFGEIKIPQGKSLADSLFRSAPPPESPKEPPGDES